MIVFLSSFPWFFLMITLYGFLVRSWTIIVIFLFSIGLLLCIQVLIKYFFPVLRPAGYKKTDLLSPTILDSSFPSHHTACSFLLYFFAQATIPQFWTLFLFFAVLVALSRIYFHKHYPIDIAGGFVMAYVVFTVAMYIFGILN